MEATHRYMNYLISENPIYTDEGKKIEVVPVVLVKKS